jgi:hypothetical protein
MTTSFTKAAVSYYGIDAGLPVRTDINTAEDGVLYLTLSIPIKDEDLGPIVKRMSGIEQKEEFEPLFTADISEAEVRQDYTALQPGLKSRFGSFARYKAWRMENKQPVVDQTEGVGGRKVQHVDAPEEESDGLPESVWVFGLDMQTGQHGMASDSRECPGGAEYLMQTAFLTPEQKAKYGVKT